ncbi:Chemical-damaging agent resistance protein C [Balamuthia mandrillaris]
MAGSATAASPTLKEGESLWMDQRQSPRLRMGLGWDSAALSPPPSEEQPAQSLQEGFDLDASCVAFDENGKWVDAVYFGKLKSEGGGMRHSGDNTTGEGEGEDENIYIDFAKLSSKIKALVFTVTSYSGQNFAAVETAEARLVDITTGNTLAHFFLGCKGTNATALIMCKLVRKKGAPMEWKFTAIGKATNGRSWGELLPHMKAELKNDLSIRPKFIDMSEKILILRKGGGNQLQAWDLEATVGRRVSNMIMGLGWDVIDGAVVDLDASCCVFDSRAHLLETVYFGRQQSSNRSIRHTGDNLTGEGDGDDEQILVNLQDIPQRAKALVFVVTSYRGDPFHKVETAFVRMVEESSGKELVRFELGGEGNSTALIMCILFKQGRRWMIAGVGSGCRGRIYSDVVPDMQRELKKLLNTTLSSSSGGSDLHQSNNRGEGLFGRPWLLMLLFSVAVVAWLFR